jgi:uncharacterized damage-inducible protein DinB
MSNPAASPAFLTPEELLHHWQGHRALTRRVIEAFPEDQLFEFSVAGMRSFGAMGAELLAMALPMVRGVVTGEWEAYAADAAPSTREELLQRWDESTEQMNQLWPQIPPARFHEVITAFGQYTGPGHELILYGIDNEIHHRGQGYVYLRALGIEPPPFWERGPAGEAG